MSQPNQQQTQSNQSSPPKPATVKIRMKPGSGKMLIGRKYKLMDGSVVDKRPKNMDDVADIIDDFLNQSDPPREISVEAVRALLGKDGKPSRVVDGYRMRKLQGGEMTHDKDGNELPKPLVTEDTWAPGTNAYDGNVLVASHPDALFEIVQ